MVINSTLDSLITKSKRLVRAWFGPLKNRVSWLRSDSLGLSVMHREEGADVTWSVNTRISDIEGTPGMMLVLFSDGNLSTVLNFLPD